MTDPGRVAGLTGGSGPCESWFRALLFVAAAVGQHALLPAAVRGAVVPELTKLGVDTPASINKRVRALFKRI